MSPSKSVAHTPHAQAGTLAPGCMQWGWRDEEREEVFLLQVPPYQLVSLQIPFLCRYVFHTQGHPTADLGSHSHQSWAPLED